MNYLDNKLAELECRFQATSTIAKVLSELEHQNGCDSCDGGCRGGGFFD